MRWPHAASRLCALAPAPRSSADRWVKTLFGVGSAMIVLANSELFTSNTNQR
jgi:formate/nitrite transporter FocA (FNT family)